MLFSFHRPVKFSATGYRVTNGYVESTSKSNWSDLSGKLLQVTSYTAKVKAVFNARRLPKKGKILVPVYAIIP